MSASQYSVRADYPDDYDTGYGDDPAAVLIGGGSCVVNPHGEFLAEPNHRSEAMLIAEVDIGEIARGTYDFDVVGHYARPDVFRLHVNEAEQQAVATTEWDDEAE